MGCNVSEGYHRTGLTRTDQASPQLLLETFPRLGIVCSGNLCSPWLCIFLPGKSSPDYNFVFFPLKQSWEVVNSGQLEDGGKLGLLLGKLDRFKNNISCALGLLSTLEIDLLSPESPL